MSIFLLGDSHAHTLVKVAAAQCWPVYGGHIAPGRLLNAAGFFTTGDGDVRFLHAESEANYRAALASAGAVRLADITMPVLCLFGMNLHYQARAEVWDGFAIAPDAPGRFLSAATVRATLRAQIAGAIALHGHLAALGLTVFSSLPPRRCALPPISTRLDVLLRAEELLVEEIAATGTRFIDHRPWSLGPDGQLKPQFASPADSVHGSEAFCHRLLEDVFAAVRAG